MAAYKFLLSPLGRRILLPAARARGAEVKRDEAVSSRGGAAVTLAGSPRRGERPGTALPPTPPGAVSPVRVSEGMLFTGF